MPTPSLISSRRTLIEIALIFAVFCIQGAWPVPDVNEPYYLGKAIHYWNPAWLRGDFFMESADAHTVFYFTFGWLSLWLSPVALVWTGRILTWLLLAWAWQRLSAAVVPRPWLSVLTAGLFACLMDRCHMAGEWVVGGVEAKGFAYVLVFLGLEAMVRNRWNRAGDVRGGRIIPRLGRGMGGRGGRRGMAGGAATPGWPDGNGDATMGDATMLGWQLYCRPNSAGAAVQLPQQRDPSTTPDPTYARRPPLHSLWPGIVGGMLLSLPGLAAVLALDWGIDRETVQAAHQIYVFDRLPHHLTLTGINSLFILRFVLLWLFWLLLPRFWPGTEASRRLRAFVTGAMTIAWIGALIQPLIYLDRALAADLLRFYWFRLSDVALPLGVALELAALAAWALAERPVAGRRWLALALAIAMLHLGLRGGDRVVAAAAAFVWRHRPRRCADTTAGTAVVGGL